MVFEFGARVQAGGFGVSEFYASLVSPKTFDLNQAFRV